MKKLMVSLLAGAMTLAAVQAGWAADALTLQLKWVTQAQFAGYYVAKDKGFYTEENIDITIKPGSPDAAPEQVIAGGGADVIVTWMAGAPEPNGEKYSSQNTASPESRPCSFRACLARA